MFFAAPTFHSCTVTSIQEVTHDTNLYCVQFPDGYRMVIPLGYHVQIKTNIEGKFTSQNISKR